MLDSSDMRELARAAKRLRGMAPRERDVTIGGIVDRIAGDAKRQHARLGSLIEAWEELIPAPLAAATRVDGLRAGCLHVIAASPSVAWSLDRALRGGAEALLRERCRGALVRVRVTVGGLDDGGEKPPAPTTGGAAPLPSQAGARSASPRRRTR